MRQYDAGELAALRCVDRHEWNHSGDPAVQGPAQFATGAWWPTDLDNMAARLEARAKKYRLAAAALRREIDSGRHGYVDHDGAAR